MNNRLLHNIYIVVLVALSLVSQEMSAMGSWLGPNSGYRNLQQSSRIPAIYPKTYFSSMNAPIASNTPSHWFSGWNSPSISSISKPSWIPSGENVRSTGNRLWEGAKYYAPTTQTPSNIWSGVKSRGGSLYEQLPTGEQAWQNTRALPGQALGLAQTGLATYAGRPVISGASAVGSTGSWLGSKLGSGLGWAGSYAPQVAKDYANRAGQYISENAYAPAAEAFSANVWNPATNYLSQTKAADLLSSMSDEQKQAAVGLAAVLAAGLAAKKGYDYWRGPSAYSEFTASINEAIVPMLSSYAFGSSNELKQKISDTINGYKNVITDPSIASSLSKQEAMNLLQNLNSMEDQLVLIDNIHRRITALNQIAYDDKKISRLFNNIAQSPILTDQQKQLLQGKLNNISIFPFVQIILKNGDKEKIRKTLEDVRNKFGFFEYITEDQQESLIEMLTEALRSK